MSRFLKLSTSSIVMVMLTACSGSMPWTSGASSPSATVTTSGTSGRSSSSSNANTLVAFNNPIGSRVDINSGYTNTRLNNNDGKLPSLEEMQNLKPTEAPSKDATNEDRLRAPALRDAALSYGARGGLAWASRQINSMLEAKANELSRVYDFNRMIIRENGGVTLLPPVISESQDTYEQQDAGRTLRVADRYYKIIEQARFAPVAPLWHTYLMTTFSVPDKPQDALLPKNDGERDLWKKFVAEGWDHGVDQALDTYRINLARLERDYTGMIRYSELLEKNMVSAPVVASQALGVTGTGSDMRENDQVYRITRDPHLNVRNPGEYHAPVSNLDPVEAATPPGGSPGISDH